MTWEKSRVAGGKEDERGHNAPTPIFCRTLMDENLKDIGKIKLLNLLSICYLTRYLTLTVNSHYSDEEVNKDTFKPYSVHPFKTQCGQNLSTGSQFRIQLLITVPRVFLKYWLFRKTECCDHLESGHQDMIHLFKYVYIALSFWSCSFYGACSKGLCSKKSMQD